MVDLLPLRAAPPRLLTAVDLAALFRLKIVRFRRIKKALMLDHGFPEPVPGTRNKWDPEAVADWFAAIRRPAPLGGRAPCEVYDLTAIRAALHESLDAELNGPQARSAVPPRG